MPISKKSHISGELLASHLILLIASLKYDKDNKIFTIILSDGWYPFIIRVHKKKV